MDYITINIPKPLRKSQNLLVFRHPQSRAKAPAARSRLTFPSPTHTTEKQRYLPKMVFGLELAFFHWENSKLKLCQF